MQEVGSSKITSCHDSFACLAMYRHHTLSQEILILSLRAAAKHLTPKHLTLIASFGGPGDGFGGPGVVFLVLVSVVACHYFYLH